METGDSRFLTRLLFDYEKFAASGFKIQKRDLEILYRYAEYFVTFTVAGTALEKMARYPLVNIKITSKPENKKKIIALLRKIRLIERLLDIAMNYLTFGLGAGVPMMSIKKQLKCRHCKTIYDLKDQEIKGRKRYRLSGGRFYMQCRNKECSHYGKSEIFDQIDATITDLNKMNIAVWSPYQLRPIFNEITGNKQWMFKIPPNTAALIKEQDHFILCTTPKLYIDAVFKSKTSEIVVDNDSVFIFEAPTRKIAGKPIPPMVRAFRSLALNETYMAANKHVAEELLIPFRTMFPIDRGSMGRPIQQTIGMPMIKTKVQQEIKNWKAKKGDYVAVFPIEMGSKDFWGNGKLLVLDSQLRSNTQDILAELGSPLEFIYGGATWSRQNVSAIILENAFKVMATMLQQILDNITEKINKADYILSDSCTISLGVPRLVEAMAENSYIKDGMEKGDVTPQTYYANFNIDYDEEVKYDAANEEKSRKSIEQKGKNMGYGEVARQKVMDSYQQEQRSKLRNEQIKDSLVMAAVNNDNMAKQIESQKKLMEMSNKEQLNSTKVTTKIQEASQLRLMKANAKQELKMLREKMKIDLEGQQKQMYGQQEATDNIENQQSQKEQERIAEVGFNSLTPEDKESMKDMPEGEKMQALVARGQEVESGSGEKDKKTKPKVKGDVNNKNVSPEKAPKKVSTKKLDDLIVKLVNTPEGNDREQILLDIHNLIPEAYDDVVKMTDNEITKYYVESLMGVEPGEEDAIMAEIKSKHPRLHDIIGDEVKRQMVIMNQARQYAMKLFNLRKLPDQYKKFVEQMVSETPKEFRTMIFKYYDMLVNTEIDDSVDKALSEKMKEPVKKVDTSKAKEIAGQLAGMDEKSRKEMLLNYQQSEPELYATIMAEISKIKK